LSWLDAELGNQVESFQATGAYQEWKSRLQGEYDSLLAKIKEAGNEYHEYQWLIGRLSGIEIAQMLLDELVMDGTEAGKNIVG
jgi:hypothetical protein